MWCKKCIDVCQEVIRQPEPEFQTMHYTYSLCRIAGTKQDPADFPHNDAGHIMTKYRRSLLNGNRSFFGSMPAGPSQGQLVNPIAALWEAFRTVNAVYPSSIGLKSYNPGIGLTSLRKRLP
ncbi:hypothetical protein EBAPG3_15040 [Nitrosospira lacus]|uniref:Uncharacterized protein n=1 Tax=Nitrosospira lacus TaxID=1288494 RepID=A0A1W6SQD0_9PROT|nr:hypothetical protein EBAPG3_15040 [Nitrosospira lacus]